MKGFAGARTTEIAKQAGVTHAMLHYYFNTKEQLFEQVMNEKMQQLLESVSTVFQTEELPVVEKIVEVVVRHFEFLCGNPDLPRFVINEMAVRPDCVDELKKRALPRLKEAAGQLQRDLDAAARNGEVAKTDAATLLMDIVSVNVFPFIVAPILAEATPHMDFQSFLQTRLNENVQLILNRINPDIK